MSSLTIGFIFGILAAPGAALDFKIATQVWRVDAIQVDEKLLILVTHQPAQTILVDRVSLLGLKYSR